jgi:biopolymer transport protein ExbD
MPITKARLKISDYNENRKSRLRNQERKVRMVSLSLTSMVDMFAILVIFLLANSASFQDWLKVGHNIELPKAKSKDIPEKAATLQISKDGVYGDDKLLMPLAQFTQNPEALKRWLSKLDKKKGGYINVVAHTKLPFGVVKHVIATCQDSGFNNVNLAIQPKG